MQRRPVLSQTASSPGGSRDLDRRAILAAAWAGARTLAATSGRSAREHLGEAQRAAWVAARDAAVPTIPPAPVVAVRSTLPAFAPLATAKASDPAATAEAAVSACLVLGEAIFAAARRLDGSGERADARTLGRLGAAVELAALAAGDREVADRDDLAHAGRLH